MTKERLKQIKAKVKTNTFVKIEVVIELLRHIEKLEKSRKKMGMKEQIKVDNF